MKIEKVFTFLFVYYVGDGICPQEITFCESTEEMAKRVFYKWCTEEYGDTEISVAKIQIIFNRWDSEAYGKVYGTPEEYYKG